MPKQFPSSQMTEPNNDLNNMASPDLTPPKTTRSKGGKDGFFSKMRNKKNERLLDNILTPAQKGEETYKNTEHSDLDLTTEKKELKASMKTQGLLVSLGKKQNRLKTIELDQLISKEEDNELWKITSALMGDFQNILKQEIETLEEVYQTVNTLKKKQILNKNTLLYSARLEVIIQIKDILSSLNSIFEQSYPNLSRLHHEALYHYLKEAVEEAMSVNGILSDTTDLESLDHDKKDSLFKGNSFLFDFMNKKAHDIKNERKKSKFECLVKIPKFACLILDTWDVQTGVQIPEPHLITAALMTFIKSSSFQNTLSNQPKKYKLQPDSYKLLLDFNQKTRTFLKYNVFFQKTLDKLIQKSGSLTEPDDFERYSEQELTQEVRVTMNVMNALIKYQSIKALKEQLNQNPEIKESLKEQLKLLKAKVTKVIETETKQSELIAKTDVLIAEDRPIIHGYYSLKYTIRHAIDLSLKKHSDSFRLEISQQATYYIILAFYFSSPLFILSKANMKELKGDELKVATWVSKIRKGSNTAGISIDPIKTNLLSRQFDKNIYLSKEWFVKTLDLFETIDLNNLKENPRKKEKENENKEKFYNKLVVQMTEFYLREINSKPIPKETRPAL